jgi:tRNA dimethylallyltransferase
MPECAPDYTLRADLEKKEAKKPGFLHEQLKAIDPEEAQKLHPNSTRYLIRALEIFYLTGKTKTEGYIQQTVSHPLLMLGLRRDKESTNQLINQRIKQMFKDGLIEEVEGLLKEGYSPNLQSMQGI